MLSKSEMAKRYKAKMKLERPGQYKAMKKKEKARYKKAHPEKNRVANNRRNANIKSEVFAHYSGSDHPHCVLCGEDRMEFLELNVIGGGGKEYKRRIRNPSLYRHLRMNGYPEGFRVLCGNCNTRLVKIAARDNAQLDPKKMQYYLKNEKLKRLAYEHYSRGSPKCACCGESDFDVLCLDHIAGNGAEHRRSLNKSNASKMHKWVVRNNYPDGFRVLCNMCNNSIGRYGYCPHNNSVPPTPKQ